MGCWVAYRPFLLLLRAGGLVPFGGYCCRWMSASDPLPSVDRSCLVVRFVRRASWQDRVAGRGRSPGGGVRIPDMLIAGIRLLILGV
jgi:hypothetical protein